MRNSDEIEEREGPDWKLLAWPISGMVITGALILVAILADRPDCGSAVRPSPASQAIAPTSAH